MFKVKIYNNDPSMMNIIVHIIVRWIIVSVLILVHMRNLIIQKLILSF